MKRDVLGGLFALAILGVLFYLLVDVHVMKLKPIDRNGVLMIAFAAFFGLLGFMFITGRGFESKPRPSKYEREI